MAKSLYDETREFQRDVVDYLINHNGYIERKNKDFDRAFAIDSELLFKFLNETQEEEMEELRKIYKEHLEDTLLNFINNTISGKRGSLIQILKNGIDVSNIHLDLMYIRPETDFNKDLVDRYNKNIFSVIQELWASDRERVDIVIFLNGFAIMTFELKSNSSGQSYHNAIKQYREDRNPKTRLFRWKSGAIVHFAMDLQEVHMTTKIDGSKTFFLPFNMGKGEGVNTGAGNPIFEDKLSVSYMWEDILTKDTILELIGKFVYIETKEKEDQKTGKMKIEETIIFPRYHQLDLIRKLLIDIKENKTSQNYLIEHSAGSGKTNSIAWLSHRLASFHDENNEKIYDNIIIVTDRVVVDRQLQKAVMNLEHKSGLIRVMDDDCTSADLADAIKGNTKIIATTIQKFPYIVEELYNLKTKNFAVIIDEAHSSTSGKNMQAILKTLGSDEEEISTAEDMIVSELQKTGKQDNISMFAFTATPKPTTLRHFGRLNPKGQYEAFHLYSMKQAIEEGFILDVLANYTTYQTMFRINKEIEEDPDLKTSEAKRQIARFIELHETNITQRIEVIIEHFRQNVMHELGGRAKAMVVTASREGAVRYRKALEDYIVKKGYKDISALVAFSGKIELDGDDRVYTEVSMNKMSEESVPIAFDSENYNVMIVANKYQTGFDQNKLSAMYIMKKLKGVNAVQTISRLNRICPPFDKKVFVLDFANDYSDIKDAFAPYYTTTLLANDLTPRHIYDLEVSVDAYGIIDPLDIDKANDLIFRERSKTINQKEKMSLIQLLNRSDREIKRYNEKEQKEILMTIKSFIRFYEYLMQVSALDDADLHKKYVYLTFLVDYVNINESGPGFNLDGKIRATNFEQVQKESHVKGKMTSKPVVKLPVVEAVNIVEDKKKKLSEIIADINSRMGTSYDEYSASNVTMQIIMRLLESDKLKVSARNNTLDDFELAYDSQIEDIIADSFEQNEEFFTLLLNNEEARKEVLGIFSGDIYKKLINDTAENEANGHIESRDNELRIVAEGKGDYGKKEEF